MEAWAQSYLAGSWLLRFSPFRDSAEEPISPNALREAGGNHWPALRSATLFPSRNFDSNEGQAFPRR